VLRGVGGEGGEGFELGPGVEPAAHGVGVLLLPVVEADGDVGAGAKEKADDVVPLFGALLYEDEEPFELGEGTAFAFKLLLELKEARGGELCLAKDVDAGAEDEGFGGEEFGGVELDQGAGAERTTKEGLEGEYRNDVTEDQGVVPMEDEAGEEDDQPGGAEGGEDFAGPVGEVDAGGVEPGFKAVGGEVFKAEATEEADTFAEVSERG
jgi:hypothetical protein